jgi:imidazolonepropionase-like amidohydrolase
MRMPRVRMPASNVLNLHTGSSALLALFLLSVRPPDALPALPATLVLTGATIYPSPTEPPIRGGVLVMEGGRVVAVGPSGDVRAPAGATTVDCAGLFITSGFQNSHVHFSEAKWDEAARKPAAQLAADLGQMLLRYGFTTVVDTGSLLANTIALRTRVEAGEVDGPRILTAGGPLYPENGIPYYLKGSLPAEVIAVLNTPRSPEEAAAVVERQLGAGADAVKLFTGSWVERGRVLPMAAPIARTAADVAHRRGKLVFAHASNLAGLEAALEARVDVLAHALDDDRGWNESHVARMKAVGMAMIPTLKLFGGQPYTKYIQEEVGTYARAGGSILFGTDVGYLTDYDPSDEYALLAGAGLDWRAILASLTTAPAERWREGARRGRIAAGMDADVVVLAGDPAIDGKAFADVRYAVRAGRLVYRRPH